MWNLNNLKTAFFLGAVFLFLICNFGLNGKY